MKSAVCLLSLALIGQAIDLNALLAAVNEYFPDNIAIKTADTIISKAESAVGKLIGVQEIRNDLIGGSCGDVMVIFARGTGEPGNIGALVAPQFYNELVSALDGKTVSMQGINSSVYPAIVADYFTGGSQTGAEAMCVFRFFTVACSSVCMQPMCLIDIAKQGFICEPVRSILPGRPDRHEWLVSRRSGGPSGC